jgi:hypothetical protein
MINNLPTFLVGVGGCRIVLFSDMYLKWPPVVHYANDWQHIIDA